jgi:hypothetical protein
LPADVSASDAEFFACAGGTSTLHMQMTFQGNLYGNRPMQLQVLRGNFILRNPGTGQTGSTINVTSDHSGTILALVEVSPGVPTQVAIVRVIDTATGVYADQAFVIGGTPLPGNAPLTTVPTDLTFTGGLSTECGTGVADVLVFDGTPPYTAFATNPNTSVTPTTTSTTPGRFTVSANNKFVCLDKVPVVITDANNQRATVTVTTELGTAKPPTVQPFTVQPTTLTVACGQTGSVSVAGGNGVASYSVNSDHPRVIAFTFNNTVSVTRMTGDGPTVFPTTANVSVTDGSSVQTVTVTVPANCP